MGSGRGREQQYTNTANADAAAIQPSAAETAANARLNLFNSQVASGRDIKDISAINPYYQIYQGAVGQQNADRQGTGGTFNLARGGNSKQAENYLTQANLRKQQDAAGQLSEAYSATNADLNNQGFQYAQLANNRNLGKASLSQNALRSYLDTHQSGLQTFMQFANLGINGARAFSPGGF